MAGGESIAAAPMIRALLLQYSFEHTDEGPSQLSR
ncbi:hypothetical protein PSYMO_38363, partial [Pseudomonas amygdali pv. mori str. 301020]